MPSREQLEGLLEQSRNGEVMEKRSKEESNLAARLVRAYTPTGVSTEQAAKLEKEVRSLVAQTFKKCARVKISDKHLTALEDQVRSAAAKYRGESKQNKAESDFISTSGDESIQKPSTLPNDDYQVLMEAERVTHLLEEQRKRVEVAANKKHIKTVLDGQVEELRRAREHERKEAEEDGKRVYAESQAYHAELRRKAAEDTQLKLKDKQEREEQYQQEKRIKERQTMRQKREEEQELLRIEEEKAVQRQREAQRKREQADFILKVQEENAKQKIERQKQKEREWEEDAKMNAQHAAKLAKEEKQREDSLKALAEKSSKNQQMFVEATASANEALREVERKAQQYLEQKWRDDERKHADKESKRKEDLRDIHLSLTQQIAVKEKIAQEQREARLEASKIAKLEAERQLALTRQEAIEKKKRAEQYREELDRQVGEKSTVVTERLKMQGQEAVLNSTKMNEIHSDKMLVELVKRNMTIRPAQLKEEQRQKRKAQAQVLKSYH